MCALIQTSTGGRLVYLHSTFSQFHRHSTPRRRHVRNVADVYQNDQFCQYHVRNNLGSGAIILMPSHGEKGERKKRGDFLKLLIVLAPL